ncbi:nitrate/nitrite two-component system sensor histidine kinase NarQ [Vibrio parahaemolyticus]|uniref:nitrate/nitrite two-component system sensor histidine kinase NarQ n=1 Tax=Vibrio parahaemolyticus TaxID=670 RepID=UPI00200A5725|nr:nitrate/nitrite two-component system sensor histidine kinase NarQ [Vibrio parahaemolyticus]EHR0756522.1 nitrate/nitrite two-component system sensor histidine kinase NarQ [Vibrio parahaemolyticus]EHR0830082.1 nitrate/nitrite two-component system sensor histidine kinase NarQ [Vibrio parahaemolyticus]EHR1157097.1 nitrate/nitrite two-component system sensor histidine kinase NarQ [Vibrio parahaemolyticus]EHR5007001.1 nitrate/nitrite two-component system sensor histidine kinase NarQ [Vibrio paraha
MFKNVKKSVTRTIASAMLLILLLSVATTGFAIFTLASSLNDAEAVNVAGSMRMQSYRLAHDIQIRSVDYSSHIDAFEHSIYSPSMKALQHWSVPEDITHDYYRLIMRWHELKSVLRGEDPSQYQLLVAGFVQQIDDFVFKLQNFSEQKLINLAWIGGLGLGGILCASMFVVHFIRLEVVRPLRALVFASERIKNRSFDINLAVSSDNEMGILTRTFNRMATDLGKLYRGLEQAVDEKTRKLQHANQSLEVLYDSSKELTASRINQDNFQAILKHIASLEGIKAVKLEIEQLGEPNWILTEGEECCHDCDDECHAEPLTLDGEHLGSLYWKAGLPCPNETLIDNFVQILSRAVYYNRAQRQAEQILLMEERATIARELHDSLAQALSYLKIQVALLKRSVKNLPDEKAIAQANQVIAELDTGLSAAYTQLRELLTTFRLTIKEGSFGQALQEMVETLNEQTTAEITLKNRLSSTELDAHQQVHLLQLIREATLNAIKHAQADHIHIQCLDCDGKVTVTVSDDGVGFEHQDEKINHYGMTIMQERAARLHADLQIEASINKGCTVKLEFQHSKEVNFDSV